MADKSATEELTLAEIAVLNKLSHTRMFVEAMNCGMFSELCCLAESKRWATLIYLLSRFDAEEVRILIAAACACPVKPKAKPEVKPSSSSDWASYPKPGPEVAPTPSKTPKIEFPPPPPPPDLPPACKLPPKASDEAVP